jgi:ribosomal protein L24
MLILNVQSLHTLDPVPFPSLREIRPFVEAGFITHKAALDMTSHEELARLRPGDGVQLIAGEQAGNMAMVVAFEDYVAYVVIDSVDMDPNGLSDVMNVPIHHMQHILHIGDNVRVREDAEELAGSSGRVVAVSEDQQVVCFIQDKTRNPVRIFIQTAQGN